MKKIFKRNKCRYKESAVGKRATLKEVERFVEELESFRRFCCDYVSPIPESVWERVETIKRKAALARES